LGESQYIVASGFLEGVEAIEVVEQLTKGLPSSALRAWSDPAELADVDDVADGHVAVEGDVLENLAVNVGRRGAGGVVVAEDVDVGLQGRVAVLVGGGDVGRVSVLDGAVAVDGDFR